jgi:RNA polymerase subunit RPABC4/transcription elongation factor Spt4
VIDKAITPSKLHALSEKLARVACEYCESANPLGEANCLSCGAPLGDAHPTTCHNCGFVVTLEEVICPNCGGKLH